MKKALVILLTLLCIFSVVSCDSKDETTTSDTSKNLSDKATTSETSVSTAPASIGTVGDSVQNTQWKLTLFDAKVYDKVGFLIPEDGNQYLVLFFEAENISSNSGTLAVTLFSGIGATYRMLISDVDNYKALNGTVAAGGKLQGYVAWEIGPRFTKLEVSYKDLINNSEVYSFVVKPENITNYNG